MAGASDRAVDYQLCVALNRATRAINGCYRPPLAEIGLTYGQYAVMLVLWESGATTLGDLARALHLDSGTLSPMLKRMADADLLVRRRSDDDQRVLEITSTERGLALRSAAAAVQRSVEEKTGMTHGELVALRSQLNELTDRLRRPFVGA